MTCPEMELKLAEFLAGELTDRSDVEEHLLACADCRGAFSTARAGWEAAGTWTVPGPSGDAIAATLSSLEPARRPVRLIRTLQLGTLAACAAIVFALSSSRVDRPAPPAAVPPVAASAAPALASLRPSVGLLFVRDENGRPAGELAIRRLEVRVDIRDGIARTEIEEVFQNRTDRRLEGTFQFPLPPDASISRLAMEIDGKLMEGEVVEREKARQTYEGIVRSMKDPALLEWMPGGIFQCRIFPIEPRSDKRIVIAYTQALSVFDRRGRYVYPLAGESMRELGIERFEFAATVRSSSKLSKSGSTSHDAPTIRIDDRTMRTTFAHSDFRPRADFVVAYETESAGEIQVAVHRPEGEEAGYFAAFVTPRSDPEEDRRRDRKIYFLLDVSGSVARAELEAARLVVRRMIQAMGPNDRFRIGSHNILVGSMAEFVAPDEAGRRAAERYLGDLVPAGASDVATALETILRDVPDDGEVAYVGEGTPTWGEKDPAAIVARVRTALGTKRASIRTIAVGSDAEKSLLETIAREFNGGAHAISPSDDVGSRADEIARTLGRSALADLKAEFEGAVTDAAPGRLGSLHFGERLLVTGRYAPGKAKLILTGRVHDRTIRREFALDLPEREAGNLHVKRLWAQRRLADLASQGEAKRAETVALSVRHQVMTPYTSFLVLENEKAYEQHQIDRTKKDADQTKDPKLAVSENARKREVLEAIAHLLEQAYAAFDQRRFDMTIKLCEEVLAIDPRYSVAAELKEDAQKTRRREEYYSFTAPKVENWRKETRSTGEAVIPRADTVVFPSAAEWAEFSKKSTTFNKLTEETVEQTANGGLALSFATPPVQSLTGTGISGGTQFPRMLRAAPDDLRDDGYYVEGRGEVTPSQPLPFLGDLPRFDFLFSDSVDIQAAKGWATPDPNRGPGAGYDIGGVGFMELDGAPSSDPIFFPEQRETEASESVIALRHGNSKELAKVIQELLKNGSEYSRLSTYSKTNMGYSVLNTTGGLGLNETSLAALQDEVRIQQLQRQAETSKASDQVSRASRQEAERLVKQLGELEKNYLELRDREKARVTTAHLNSLGIRTDVVAPRKPLQAQVTAVARELDLVVISIGRDAGVNEGDEFTIYRGSEFIGKIAVDRLDRAWASGRIVLKGKAEPRIGDQASNNVLAVPGKGGQQELSAAPPQPFRMGPRRWALQGQVTAVAKDLDLVVLSIGRDAGVSEGDEFTISRGNEMVCKVAIDRVDRAWASGRIVTKGKSEPRIGDQASTNVPVNPEKGVKPEPRPALPHPRKVVTITGDEVGLAGLVPSTVKVGDVYVLARDWQYVAAVQVITVADSGVKARILPRLRALSVQEGDAAVRIDSRASLWSVLPEKIRQEIVSERALAEARAKLGWLRKAAR
jgi:hypothetical protein